MYSQRSAQLGVQAHRQFCVQPAKAWRLSASPAFHVQGIAAELEHPGHRRRMAMVCRAWAAANPVTSLDVVLHKGLGLTELRGRLAALVRRHQHLSSLRFRCAT